MIKELIEPVVHGGAIVLCLYALFWAWQTTKQDVTKIKLKLLRTIMGFSALILILSGAIEITKMVLENYSNKKVQIASMEKVGLNAFLGTIFEPQRESEAVPFSYLGRAPNGYDKVTDDNSIFQDFSTDFLVQRLWADPRYADSLIKVARVDDNGKAIAIHFVRKGWGCDVTIKQKYNRTAYTEKFSKIVLIMQTEDAMISKIRSAGADAIGFRLRLVDGRDNHWSWGRPGRSQDIVSVNYEIKDSTGKDLSLKDCSEQTFTFDISDRQRWTIFSSDGGIAPIQPNDRGFKFISMVVIEPGIISHRRVDPDSGPDPYKHRRYLAESPIDPTTGLPLESTFLIKSIYFLQ